MNAQRRKRVQAVADMLLAAQTLLEEIAAEEREYFDNMPEALQGSERGQRADEVATMLEDAASAVDDVDLSDALS